MNKRSIFSLTATASACALLLAACGGGGGGDAMPADPLVSGTDVPQSATQSSAGAFIFVSGVAASSSETAQPLVLGDVTLATSETEEPSPI